MSKRNDPLPPEDLMRSNARYNKLILHEMNRANWYGFDFDRTLVQYHGWKGPGHVGENIQDLVDLLVMHMERGDFVKIFTARVHPILSVSLFGEMEVVKGATTGDFLVGQEAVRAIQRWCMTNLNHGLPITCVKDPQCLALYDDIAVQVVPNEGRRADGKPLHTDNDPTR